MLNGLRLNSFRLPGSLWAYVALAGVALAGGGCQDHLTAERDALYEENRELRDQLSETRLAWEGAEADRAQLIEQIAEAEEQAASSGFQDIDGVSVEAGAGFITVRVPGDVLFDPGQVDVKSSASQTLSEIAGVLESEYGGHTVRIEGYTDTDPIRHSDWTDNLELSGHRAMAVQRHLAEQGISAERMYSAAFGETRPRETKTESRRVEIVVVMTPEG